MSDNLKNIHALKQEFDNSLKHVTNQQDLENLKLKFLGRKNGLLTEQLSKLSSFSIEEKRQLGPELNSLRNHIEQSVEMFSSRFSASQDQIDITLPKASKSYGHLHPLTQVQEELEDIFHSLGFTTEFGPEVESDWYNFTALNMPEFHPARDMQDTFYLTQTTQRNKIVEKLVMRTQTSPMQIRFMETHKPPFALLVPGRVFRNEATDITHEHTFSQMEGLVVGENISYSNMMWTLEYALKKFFGSEAKIKFLPSYFPFVEPGAEVAISHPNFHNGKWVEILGCGMVHQKVFESSGYKKNQYQGFAFGFGITRFALMKYGIPDIRLLAENNLQFLNQF